MAGQISRSWQNPVATARDTQQVDPGPEGMILKAENFWIVQRFSVIAEPGSFPAFGLKLVSFRCYGHNLSRVRCCVLNPVRLRRVTCAPVRASAFIQRPCSCSSGAVMFCASFKSPRSWGAPWEVGEETRPRKRQANPPWFHWIGEVNALLPDAQTVLGDRMRQGQSAHRTASARHWALNTLRNWNWRKGGLLTACCRLERSCA